jgi:hypothetical protein
MGYGRSERTGTVVVLRRVVLLLALVWSAVWVVSPGGAVQSAHNAVTPIVPSRVLDTREPAHGASPVPAGTTRTVKIAGVGAVPADATAVFLNVTAVYPSAPGFLTVFPCGGLVPTASNVNYLGGDVSPNAVLAKVGPNGQICIFSLATSHVIVDVAGYVPAGAAVVPTVPRRAIDTRDPGQQRVAAGSTMRLRVAGTGDVPAGASAAFLNVTAVYPTAPGFLTVFPCGPVPTASNVNYQGGDVAPNAVLAKISDTGEICIFSLADTDIIVDVAGYVPAGGAVSPIDPQRVIDTRLGAGRVGAGTILRVPARGVAGVPASATAVFANVTAVDPDAPGFLTVFPCGAVPTASNVNYQTGDVSPNAVFAKLSDTGEICIFTLANTDVIVDLAGYVAPATAPDVTDLHGVLGQLTVADYDPARPPYVRDDYDGNGWRDYDGDCINTRNEVLAERSEIPATFSGCNVTSGQWTDPYDGAIYTLAVDVQIDHLVALAEAHRSGGWRWDSATKERFANDTTNDHLVVAGGTTNQSKADKRPDQWMPPLDSADCWYAISWIEVKYRYHLTVMVSERATLDTALDTCAPGTEYGDLSPANISYTAPPAPTTTTTPPPVTTTTLPPAVGTIQIVSCNAPNELVVIRNPGGSTVSLIGWTLHDQGVNHSVDLGTLQGSLGAGQQLGIKTGPDPAGAGQVKWKSQNVWNNDGDNAYVVSPSAATTSLACST